MTATKHWATAFPGADPADVERGFDLFRKRAEALQAWRDATEAEAALYTAMIRKHRPPGTGATGDLYQPAVSLMDWPLTTCILNGGKVKTDA